MVGSVLSVRSVVTHPVTVGMAVGIVGCVLFVLGAARVSGRVGNIALVGIGAPMFGIGNAILAVQNFRMLENSNNLL